MEFNYLSSTLILCKGWASTLLTTKLTMEMPMHKCEFCNTIFTPRSQTKNPRACKNESCQKQRQYANEKEWRQKNKHLSDSKYHQIRRQQRQQKINTLIKSFLYCFEIGKNFLNLPFSTDAFFRFFQNTISKLGIRSINKFWNFDIINNFNDLNTDFLNNFVQTSS